MMRLERVIWSAVRYGFVSLTLLTFGCGEAGPSGGDAVVGDWRGGSRAADTGSPGQGALDPVDILRGGVPDSVGDDGTDAVEVVDVAAGGVDGGGEDVVSTSDVAPEGTDVGADAGGGVEPGGTDPVSTPPLAVARHVRVTTLASPSWVAWSEVEVMGRPQGSQVPLVDLASNGFASASSQTADGPPSQAINGDSGTSWNAGDFPPASWSLDLGGPMEIHEVRLHVAQNPPGLTSHQLELGLAPGTLDVVHVFDTESANGDWLVWPNDDSTPPGGGGVEPVNGLPRGLAWVRANPMFISGLTVSMGAPDAAVAAHYRDGFHATAVHTWNDGLGGAIDAWMAMGGPGTRWLSWVTDDGKSLGPEGQVIGGKGANPPGRIGYQVGDEPGLNGNGMAELKVIEEGVDAVRAADPDALIVVNFSFWADDFQELLTYFGSSMDADIYSYDRYAMDYKEHETLAQIRSAALQWKRPYWRYLRSFHYVGEGKQYGELDYRWHAFIGLLYGYTGHTWFVYQAAAPHDVASDFYPAQGNFSLSEEVEWGWAAAINLEMREIGRVLTQLTSTDVRYVPGQSLYLPDGLVEWSPGAGADPWIESITAPETGLFDVRDFAVGFFEDDAGEGYVMIQNQNHPNASYPIDNSKTSTVEVIFNFQGAPEEMDTSHLLRLDPTSGAEELIPLIPLGGGQWKLSHSVPSAELLFFKYATGAPFAKGL